MVKEVNEKNHSSRGGHTREDSGGVLVLRSTRNNREKQKGTHKMGKWEKLISHTSQWCRRIRSSWGRNNATRNAELEIIQGTGNNPRNWKILYVPMQRSVGGKMSPEEED